MGRKSVTEKGSVFSFCAPPDLSARLDQYKESNPRGFSAFICSCVEAKIGVLDRELLNSKLRELDFQMIEREQELTDLKISKARIEATLRDMDVNRDKVFNQRIKLLERAQANGWLRNKANFVGYATGPAGVELLSACGFNDPGEAIEWMEENARLVVQ